MLENEPTHLIMCSIVSDDPILPITVDRIGVPVFWSKSLWMRFLQGTAGFETNQRQEWADDHARYAHRIS